MGLGLQLTLAGVPEFMRSTTEEEARTRVLAAYLPYLALGIPAAIIALVGGKMAKETKPLISVSARVDL